MDLSLSVSISAQEVAFEKGVDDFFQLLHGIENIPAFDLGWSMAGFSLWDQSQEYVEYLRGTMPEQENDGNYFSVGINDDAKSRLGIEKVFYNFRYYSDDLGAQLTGEVRAPHPSRGAQVQHYIDLLNIVTQWKRPMHVRFGPRLYNMEHHPLDRARLGIGWLGWVPFNLDPLSVPEAEIVRPMNGGSLIVTQTELWQADEGQSHYSSAAIGRAQEVEIRLNLLGVLPTGMEIARGDWGLG